MYKHILVPMALDHGIGETTMQIARTLLAEGGHITALHVHEAPNNSVCAYVDESIIKSRLVLKEIMKLRSDSPYIAGNSLSIADCYLAPLCFYVSLTDDANRVFDVDGFAGMVAERLADRRAVERAQVFPYQLMAAWMNIDDKVPSEIRDALAAAMEIAVENAPELGGRIVVAPDVSGSMTSPVTGRRKGATSFRFP